MKYALTLLLFFAFSTSVFATEMTEEELRQKTIRIRKSLNVEKVSGASFKASWFHTLLNTLELADQSKSFTPYKLAIVPVKLIELATLSLKLEPTEREKAIMDQRWPALKNYAIGCGLEVGVHIMNAYAESWGISWTPANEVGLKLLSSWFILRS